MHSRKKSVSADKILNLNLTDILLKNKGMSVVCFEGLNYLFVAKKRHFRYRISCYTSIDLQGWQLKDDCIYKSKSKIGVGSALVRGGKIYLIFDSGGLKVSQKLLTSKNGQEYSLYPIDLISKGLKEPRAFFSQGSYYMFLSQKCGKNLAVYKSQNLMSWKPDFIALSSKRRGAFSYPGLIRSRNGTILCFYEKKTGKTKLFWSHIDLDQKNITLKEQIVSIMNANTPRTFALLDGKMLLLYRSKNQSMITDLAGGLDVRI